MKFQFAYTRLFVQDCKACYEFYHNILGLEVTFVSEIDTYVELTNGSVKLTLLNRNKITEYFGRQADVSFGQKSDGIAVCFQVKDVDEACLYLKEKGVEIVSQPWNFADWGIKSALIRDPDGNLLELTQMGGMVGAE